MFVTSLELKNFRNYEEMSLTLVEGTNIFYGDNAQGKTNILEALYVCGTTKSHRSGKDREMIRLGEDEAHIKTSVRKKNRDCQIEVHLKKTSAKGIAINKIPIKKAGDLFGILNLIFFSPEDLNIIKRSPAERRRFIDAELCQIDKIYFYHLTRYHRALSQRNRLLKEIKVRPGLEDTLSVWDEQLLENGKKVIKARRQFIGELGGIVSKVHQNISGGKEHLEIYYEPNTTEEEFQLSLEECREKDLITGITGRGPHRDDLSFLANGMDLRKFGSQGQQRTCALSLKLSEIELVKQIIHDSPVLLLDDVLSELDDKRQNYLLNSICGIQTLVTCTGLEGFYKNRFKTNKVFKVENGQVF